MKCVITFTIIQIATLFCVDSLVWAASYNESKVDSLYQIVHDPEVSYTRKYKMISAHNNLSLYIEYFDKLYSIYHKLLEESNRYVDPEGTFLFNSSLANLYLCLLDRKGTETYLNQAGERINQVKNVSNLAFYYNIKAQYIQYFHPDCMPEAVHYYQLALSNYDKMNKSGKEDEIAVMLRNLSIDAFFRNDSAYIAKTIRKINELKSSRSSPFIDFYYMDVASLLHTVYYHYSSDERFLDSTIYCLQKCLDIYEKGLLPKSFDHICVNLYTIYAEIISMKKNPDIAAIDSLLSMAIDNHVDSLGMARVYLTKTRTYFNRNMIDSAEITALKSQSYLQYGYKNNDYSIEKRNFDFLRAIYEMKGDYKKAIEYNNLWSKKNDEIRANEVKELELQYEAEMKESELKRLYAEELHQQNRYKLIFLACALLCLLALFQVYQLWLKKRNLNNQIALIDAEREEMKLKVKLQEEQTVKMQLERYIALSDFRLKELEIIGKTKDLEHLYRNKEELDKQVDLYRQKVEDLEAMIKKDSHENINLQYVILDDLKRLFSRQMFVRKYIENLENLDGTYTDKIITICNENLSVSYLKYCVCFAIGMGISEVAECFNIEQSSVHMIRYRLKKKFGLSNDDDLSVFLQEQTVNDE